jgi:hypothetical protein
MLGHHSCRWIPSASPPSMSLLEISCFRVSESQTSHLIAQGESMWWCDATVTSYIHAVRACLTVPVVFKTFDGLSLLFLSLARPPGVWVHVWKIFIASKYHMCVQNNLLNLFFHQPSYFRDPCETCWLGALRRYKMPKLWIKFVVFIYFLVCVQYSFEQIISRSLLLFPILVVNSLKTGDTLGVT